MGALFRHRVSFCKAIWRLTLCSTRRGSSRVLRRARHAPVNLIVRPQLIAAGYMAKRVAKRPEWIQAPTVDDVYSVSRHVSDDFADYINYWKHNGYWFFDSIGIIRALGHEHAISLEGCKFFYYEVFDQEYDDERKTWQSFSPETSFAMSIVPPTSKRLEGYDVVTFWVHTSPECSPLSCNNLAATVSTN